MPRIFQLIVTWSILRKCRIITFVLYHCSRPSYRYSKLSQDDVEEMEGSESFKYDPRPKGLRAYRDCDTSDDVSAAFASLIKTNAFLKRWKGGGGAGWRNLLVSLNCAWSLSPPPPPPQLLAQTNPLHPLWKPCDSTQKPPSPQPPAPSPHPPHAAINKDWFPRETFCGGTVFQGTHLKKATL